MSLKLVSISLYNIKEHCETSRSHVEFAPCGINESLQRRVWVRMGTTCWQYMRVQRGLETSPWSRSCPCLGCFPTPPPGTAFHLNERLKSGEKIVECYTWLAEKSSLWPAMNWAHFLINLIASMLVSGKAALHANSERHLIASWKMNWISLNVGAIKQYLERVYHGCELGFKHLCDNFTRCLGNKELVWIGLTGGYWCRHYSKGCSQASKVFIFFKWDICYLKR